MAYTTSRPTETIERLTRTAYYLNLELYRRRIGQIAPCIAIQWKGVCSLCYQLDMLCPQVRLFKAISSTALRLLFDSASRRLRLLFDCCSTRFDCQSKNTRRIPEKRRRRLLALSKLPAVFSEQIPNNNHT